MVPIFKDIYDIKVYTSTSKGLRGIGIENPTFLFILKIMGEVQLPVD